MEQRLLDAAARAAGIDAWDSVEPMDGGRARLARVGVGERSHVLKAYRTPEDDAHPGARERAALSALDGVAGVPRLVAECAQPPLALMTELPGSGNLADALLGEDPAAAADVLGGWAEALARLHAATTSEHRSAFAAALARRAPGVDPGNLRQDFAEAAQMYAEALPGLGLSAHRHEAALAELRDYCSLLADPEHEVLSPADTCPDNNIVGPDGVHLLDFEFAELRHAAWDVAYLRAPWPSCWCAWRLPEEVADAAMERYLHTRGGCAQTESFGEAVEVATFGWWLLTPAWFLRSALEPDVSGGTVRRPGRQALVLDRLGRAAATPAGPAASASLVDIAGALHEALLERWGPHPLELAPAFRDSAGLESRHIGVTRD